jgi:Tfp pilus assembly PilM family ATPase
MSRLLALEWDSREARVAVALVRDQHVVIEQAFSVGLKPRQAGATEMPADVGARLSAALATRQVGRAQTLLAVGRASIELKVLSVPPAPPEEMLELVQFQAVREFNSLEDDWPLDFIPLARIGDGPQQVLAAAIAPDLVAQLTETCQEAELQPTRLVLRPCATASLLKRRERTPGERVRMVVDLMVDEADLTVLVDNDIVLIRTVRLPGAVVAAETAPALLGQIRRTMAAVQNQLGGDRVDAIYLCGDRDEYAELAVKIEKALGLPAHRFDPFEGIAVGRQLKDHKPEHPGRFAPLLGMLLDEAADKPHAIDFLHTRRKAERPQYQRPLALAVAALVLLVVAIGWSIRSSLAALDDEIDRKAEVASAIDKSLPNFKDVQRDVGEIDKWAVSDFVWLDELAELSEDFPPAQDAMLLGMRIAATSYGGRVDLEGLARETEVIDQAERGQRRPGHRVEVKGSRQSESSGRYDWRFDAAVHVERNDEFGVMNDE